MVIAAGDSCEIWNAYPEVNLFPDIQVFTRVGERMGLTCFYENQYNTTF
jgi:hypothetical protein